MEERVSGIGMGGLHRFGFPFEILKWLQFLFYSLRSQPEQSAGPGGFFHSKLSPAGTL